MELKKIRYSTALILSILVFFVGFINGLASIFLNKIAISMNPAANTGLTPLMALFAYPVGLLIGSYVTFLVVIFVYNILANKIPISWELEK